MFPEYKDTDNLHYTIQNRDKQEKYTKWRLRILQSSIGIFPSSQTAIQVISPSGIRMPSPGCLYILSYQKGPSLGESPEFTVFS